MRKVAKVVLISSLGVAGTVAGMCIGNAQNYALPKGSSLAATPPIDQTGKQFRALSRTQRRIYVRQGYRGPGWQAYR